MRYRVLVQVQAVVDAEEIDGELRAFGAQYADRWTDELNTIFAQLAEFPNRFAMAPESSRESRTVRQVFVGKYRVLFAVIGDAVHILRIRHAARRPFKPGDLN